jgi:hypothetical protein
MADPIEHVRRKLVERIAQIIEEHTASAVDVGSGAACSCGVQSLSDHRRHVAEQIVDQLGLMPDTIDEVKKRIRYATAVFDWELTKLEGAQC